MQSRAGRGESCRLTANDFLFCAMCIFCFVSLTLEHLGYICNGSLFRDLVDIYS